MKKIIVDGKEIEFNTSGLKPPSPLSDADLEYARGGYAVPGNFNILYRMRCCTSGCGWHSGWYTERDESGLECLSHSVQSDHIQFAWEKLEL